MFQLHLSMIESSLTEAGIPYFGGTKGGLFFWMFIGDFLQENTFEAKRQFTEYLMMEVSQTDKQTDRQIRRTTQ